MTYRLARNIVCAGAVLLMAISARAQDGGGAPPGQQVIVAPPQPGGAGEQAVVTARPSDADQPTSRPTESRSELRAARRSERRMQPQGSVASNGSSAPSLPEIVGSRNIFVRGNQTMPASMGNSGQGQLTTAQAQEQFQRAQESQLVLTGVSLANNGKVALVENHSDYSVQQVKIGDAIAFGKVVGMTLDSLDYQNKAGHIIRVQIGDNLSGGDVEGIAGSTGGGASTQPAKAGPRMPGESMEDYLKRRRSAELGH